MNYVTDDTMNAYLRTVQPMYDGVLGEIQREAIAAEVPIIPLETARLLSVLLTMQKPKHILEIGTAVGFSAGLMCCYLPEDGTVTTPYIGIMGTSITSENASLYKLPVGALIVEVTEGGPAAKAGIQAGDIITEFNGKTVMDMDSLSELVKETEIGQTVSVHIIRNGEKAMDVQLTVQDKNA